MGGTTTKSISGIKRALKKATEEPLYPVSCSLVSGRQPTYRLICHD